MLSFAQCAPPVIHPAAAPAAVAPAAVGSTPVAPAGAAPSRSTEEGGPVGADTTSSTGEADDDECQVLGVETPPASSTAQPSTTSTPPPASSLTTPSTTTRPSCRGYMPQLEFPMSKNYPFGLIDAGQPWVTVVRQGSVALFATGADGGATAGCEGTVASNGESCVPCQALQHHRLVKGEVQRIA